MVMKKYAVVIVLLLHFLNVHSQPSEKMQWFADAKLGIFIHWGIYSVNGISESWSFFNRYTSYNDYKDQLMGFTASKYNPQQWVDLIKYSGAKYAVITSKHHDGVALWNSKQPHTLTIPQHAAAKKDVLTPFVNELKKAGLKTGIYYSLPDWSYPDYDVFTGVEKRYDAKEQPERFEKFISYYQGQLQEISTQYKPDLLWFDGDWEHSAIEWKAKEAKELLQKYNSNIIINSRLTGHGDYDTPEQGVPVKKPQATYWELCYTMNDSWGYQPFDNNYKSANMLINTLVDCIAMGGNLLLDIGPKPDGKIDTRQVDILKKMGRWTQKHGAAIYSTTAGIEQKYFSGKSALSKDRKTLFLYLSNQQEVAWVRNISTTLSSVKIIGYNKELSFSKSNNDYWISIPKGFADPDVTVLQLSFDEPISFAPETIGKPDNSNNLKEIYHIAYQIAKGNNPLAKYDLKMNQPLPPKIASNSEVEKWIEKHVEVVAGAEKGLSEGHYAGLSALSPDKKTIYLFIEGIPKGLIALKGISNNIARIRIVGEGTILNYKQFDKLYWSAIPGINYIEIPTQKLDKQLTVIAVLLDAPVKEYHQEVKAIESNL